MTFPWLFNSVLAVQIVAAIAIVILLLIRGTKLRTSIGSALFSVKRLSIGELLFPLAVAWLFTLANGKPTLYCISLLLLTLADTAGAFAGSKFGRNTYSTTAATKSCEGSIAFFIIAFFCISIPLHFKTDLSLTLILFLSLTVALLTMSLEGLSGHGIDNLLIPLGAYLLLDYYSNLPENVIFLRSVILLALLALLLITHHKHTFDGGALLMSALFGFATFALGGTPCLFTVFLLFVRHLMTQQKMPQQHITTHSLDTISAIAIPSLFWLTLGRGLVIPYEIAQFGFISTLALIIAMLHTGTQKYLGKTKPSLLFAFLLSALILSPAITLAIPFKYFLPILLLSTPAAKFYFYWRKNHTNNITSN